MRRTSLVAPGWWDYTTLDREILDDAARLTAEDLEGLSREGFTVKIYETLEDFYLAEAMEYINAWRQATPDQPAGVCGPIGPTEQLPLVARLVNELGLDLRHCHFWGMDEWVLNGERSRRTFRWASPAPIANCCSTASARSCGCRRRISISRRPIRAPYIASWKAGAMRGDAGRARRSEALGLQRSAEARSPVRPAAAVAGRVSQADDARGGSAPDDDHPECPHFRRRRGDQRADSGHLGGPVETWQAEKVSIWQAGNHDNPFGQRLTALMIAKRIPDSSVPMSLLADHPNVQFNYLRSGMGACDVEMH